MSPNITFSILSHVVDFYHSFDTDPLKRHTFWTIVVGGSMMWVSIYSINQSQVQRYISCKTLGHAKMWAFWHCGANSILLAGSEGSCTDNLSFISQVFVCEHGGLVGNCESGCVFRTYHVLHLQELWPTYQRWYKHPWPGKAAVVVFLVIII